MTEHQRAFISTFEPLRERLWKFVRAMVFKYDRNDQEVARDIMNETILVCLEQFDTLRDKQAMLSFCFTVASRIYKAQFVRKKFWGLYEEEIIGQIPTQDSPPDIQTDVRLLYEAIDTLPLKIKEALILLEISDLTLEEIRVIQGGTLSGVKSRVARGRTMLAKLLNEQTPNIEELVLKGIQ
ncbi:MAG: RNA polymerase sigma factor [Ignavibacteriae bacterium]|nr:RNA polymerase sigma factor [Ignavibacteriota bacterium]